MKIIRSCFKDIRRAATLDHENLRLPFLTQKTEIMESYLHGFLRFLKNFKCNARKDNLRILHSAGDVACAYLPSVAVWSLSRAWSRGKRLFAGGNERKTIADSHIHPLENRGIVLQPALHRLDRLSSGARGYYININ